MSAFKALNIEYDEVSDVEVDDTKEIQIEEALKLYQTALRYHAEGPGSFDQASQAYKELFASEIFRYPESENELQRIELYGPIDYEGAWEQQVETSSNLTPGLDAGPSSLPQILHLSHKNYAQFKLEALAARLDELHASLSLVVANASEALQHFVSALDKDDGDIDLWKKTARVGEVLDSKRITRFCLEAVLEGDEDGLGSVLSLPGIEDGIAGEQLRNLALELDDHLSLYQPTMPLPNRKVLSRFLMRRLDNFGGMVNKSQAIRVIDPKNFSNQALSRRILPQPQDWTEMGEILLKRRSDETALRALFDPTITFDLQGEEPSEIDVIEAEERLSVLAEDINTTESIIPESAQGQHTTIRPPSQQSNDSQQRRTSVATDADAGEAQTLQLPSRKRSGENAGLADAIEEGRVKSKRLRARESIADAGESKQAVHDANVQWEFEQHLNEIQAADDWLYETAGASFSRLDITSFEGIRDVKAEVHRGTEPQDDNPQSGIRAAQTELSQFLRNYTDKVARTLLSTANRLSFQTSSSPLEKNGSKQDAQPTPTSQLSPLLKEQSLAVFLRSCNSSPQVLDDVAVDFIEMLIFPGKLALDDKSEASYNSCTWSEQLKTVVVRMLVNFDGAIYDRAYRAMEAYVARHSDETLESDKEDVALFTRLRVYLQNIFELHLDVYCLIKLPNSGVNQATILLQADRLQRWFELAREAHHLFNNEQLASDLNIDARFMWATTFYLAALEDASQDRILVYMEDLRSRLINNNTHINLVNNAVMSEISVATLDREMSKLTTKDFFERISDMEHSDPIALIEMVEPLLEALDIRSRQDNDLDMPNELVTFLENKNFAEILQLWSKLLAAYVDVKYNPMVVRTQLRMVRLVVAQMDNTNLEAIGSEDRISHLLGAMRVIDSLITKTLELMLSGDETMDCLDDQDVKLSISSFADLLRLLQAFNVFEDPIRIGKNHAPTTSTGATCPTFKSFCKAVHEMQVRTWMVLYFLFKEAINQNAELFQTPVEDRFDFLRALHRNLGIRAICGVMDRVFVRTLRDEFFTMTHVDGYDSEQAQVLFDLYGLNYFLNPSYELMDHHCTHYNTFDKAVASQTVDLVLAQARKLPMKELVRHTLKDTIDKVHGCWARKRPTDAIMKNREVVKEFLRSPIHPVDLYKSLKGEGNTIAMLHVPSSDSPQAAKGWYFLMGYISLTKFRTMKRTGPTPTDEIDIAIAMFMQELEYSTANWETWFRLAQAYDSKLEENVAWSAEKLNSSMSDIKQLQRFAIHCYKMATALAYRSADIAFETSDKMTELYTDFAMRMYSSSRQPFAMLAFSPGEEEKWLSCKSGMQKTVAFQPLRLYTAWKISKVLFQRAIVGNPKQWMLHFMLGKCLWKMHTASADIRGQDQMVAVQDVLDALYRAIELLPGRKDNRDSKREPILEPHYKLVSLVHKLVMKDQFSIVQAKEALEHTHYTNSIEFPEDRQGWITFILSVLKGLRAADKSHWHHRMIARAAQIIFDNTEQNNEVIRATEVKQELTQQMFTKSMMLNVWRPEAERPGRHFVYTAKYTTFFVRMLEILKDRANLETLARRVRRRPHEIFEHGTVWQEIISAYLRLLRERGALQEGLEMSTFSTIAHEDFAERKEPLEKWMQSQDEGDNIVLDVLREVQELKKINQNLMKAGQIDDLIGDAYAYLYSTVGKQLRDAQVKEQQEKPDAAPAAPAAPEPVVTNKMQIASLLSLDGIADVKLDLTPEPEAVPAKRRIGINKREIRAAAEACTLKPTSTTLAKNGTPAGQANSMPKTEQITAGEISVNTSAPGSVVEDADDESELSELEEAESDVPVDIADVSVDIARTSFPGLLVVEDPAHVDDSEAGDDDEMVEVTMSEAQSHVA